MQAALQRLARPWSGVTAFHVETPQGQALASCNADVELPAASTRKLSIATCVFDQLDRQQQNALDVVLPILPPDKVIRSPLRAGVLQHTDIAWLSVYDLLTFMLLLSDETATFVLCRWVGGPAAVNAYCHRIGLERTRHRYCVPEVYGPSNPRFMELVTTTTARDQSRLMRMIATNELAMSPTAHAQIWILLNLTRTHLGSQFIGKTGTSERGGGEVACLLRAGRAVCCAAVYLDFVPVKTMHHRLAELGAAIASHS